MVGSLTTEAPLEWLNPFACRMWDCHDRLQDDLTDVSCRDVIESFSRDGQKLPVLARPRKAGGDFEHELIYGARRLFAARHLNVKLLARVSDIDDRAALVEMDIENRLRRNISPYERGMSFRAWLRDRYFQSQDELAGTLGLSTAQVSRLLRFAELPTALVTAFLDPRDIRESWAVALAERCAEPPAKSKLVAFARSLTRWRDRPTDAQQVYKLLIDCDDRQLSRVRRRDEIVRSDQGAPLFRVSYRHNGLHVVIPRVLASSTIVSDLTVVLKSLLQSSHGLPEQPPLRHTIAARKIRAHLSQ
ncbi:MAG TPA: ParB/RepB/Spo0J family partition protein [Gammaproteobacteria bacterium]|nr:ParB/RepB/Spo0J family partition protein [Gammaproteobacteria bacterium]